MWLLAVQAAAAALLASRRARFALASLQVLCPRPSTRATSVWGRRTITHVRVQAVAPGVARRCSYPLQKLTCGRAENPGRLTPIYSCGHLPSSLQPFDRTPQHNKHTHDDT